MLFYKRMEPEEENGRDYKFDVSSELLEVSRDIFKYHLKLIRILVQICAVAGLLYGPVSKLCKIRALLFRVPVLHVASQLCSPLQPSILLSARGCS